MGTSQFIKQLNHCNPTFVPTYSGNFDFEITTTNQWMCKKDTLNVTILPYSNPSVNITANDSSIICYDTVNLQANLSCASCIVYNKYQ